MCALSLDLLGPEPLPEARDLPTSTAGTCAPEPLSEANALPTRRGPVWPSLFRTISRPELVP